MHPYNALFEPYRLGSLMLPNRVVMAPLTRSRAPQHLANELMVEYYRQRATAGLLISEGVAVSAQSIGYPNVPGLFTSEQTQAWRPVVDAVHKAQGRIFAQLWHVGALSHPVLLGGELPVSPSGIAQGGVARTPQGELPRVAPRAMTANDIQTTLWDFVRAAENAFEAGFDGVELHTSNGYLFHQFFVSCTNQRTDAYGGSIEGRTRILFELIERLSPRVPLERVGLRFNPSAHNYQGLRIEPDTIPTFDYLMRRLNDYPMAYVHLSEPFTDVAQVPHALQAVAEHYRPIYQGTLITNRGYTAETGAHAVASGLADLVAYGKPYIANPDLVERFRRGAPLNQPDPSTFYTSGAEGYTDYPSL